MRFAVSAEVFDMILTLKAGGMPQNQIAKRTGVGDSTVSRVVLGRALRPGICSRCGGPVHPDNAIGICYSNPECGAAAHHATYMAKTEGITRTRICTVCDRPMKKTSKYGICNRKDNPECVKAHNAARHAAHPEHNERTAGRRAVPEVWCKYQVNYLRGRGTLVDLDVPYLLELWNDGHCPICRTEYIVGDKTSRSVSPSMDRVFPKLGYRKGNVRIICMRCNWHKNDMSGADLMALAKDTLRAEAWATSQLAPILYSVA